MATPVTAATARVDWVDTAKGLCIIMVVLLHSTFGVEQAVGREGFMHVVVAFAKPFRMPDFFLISGLFLARVIDRDWRLYADRKVVHFAYFYLLWMTIQLVVKAPVLAAEHGWAGVPGQWALALVEPFGTLWFIYLLPIFFVVTKLARQLRIPPLAVWLVAAALETAPIHTGWTVPDEFAARFVYFYTGFLLAPRVFALAEAAAARPWLAAGGLAVWALVNGTLVFAGLSEWPIVSLALGFAGAGAIIVLATLLVRSRLFDPIRYCGEHSIVVYLAFFLPMAATRIVLLKTGVVASVGLMSLIVTAAGILGALAIWWAVRGTRLDFLFTRPDRAHIAARKAPAGARLQPAE
ncbi:acyltransferase family protein [Rhodoplanes sp. TEM]|uniref:Acyltransferase family protein n=1 Tax=Rhodoplanes tepidamans TaxID=200616 RepID=A0ABT5JIM6_RHOTP|nr:MULTISPECIES: acyltransferase family protein [Rhodoplanes]MDC7789382.1 acyltransferase family protein [Rhodoplanes tepidamans]MDC7984524.1 acyltransferase family protein [Rhodoplanes sp. TEM]MDQ0357933.1 putative membrane protein YcfT [Rhodoplanes tepidamans]